MTGSFGWDHAPLVEAAWCLTAERSRLNSLSAIQEGLASALLKRRWAAERIGAARWLRRAMLRENIVVGVDEELWRGEGILGERSYVEIHAV